MHLPNLISIKMKRLTFVILTFLLSIDVYAQSTIENPKIGSSTALGVSLTKVTRSDSATVLFFTTKATPGVWISIPAKTYIQDINAKEKLFIKSAEGIPLNAKYIMPASGEVSYNLTFPAIDKTTSFIDYGEANDGGTWFIYNISLNPLANKHRLSEELYGNWFNKSTGDWKLSFNDDYGVYKNQLWRYDLPQILKGVNTIQLTSDNGKSIMLYVQIEKSGNCRIGESAKDLKACSNNRVAAQKSASINNERFELPVFKLDSTTYSGYLKGYTPRIGVKTLSISLDDIITGNQTSHVIKIDENGFFTVKLPLYYPHLCYVRSSIYNGSVFLEPGKELFQMLDPSNRKDPVLFMGTSGMLNSNLAELIKINSFNYKEMQNGILDMSPEQFKTYCKNSQTKDLNAMDSIMSLSKISAKAFQIMKLELDYRSMANMMRYRYYYESGYRAKNKIPRTQRELPVKADSLTAVYFDFINNESVNNPLNVIASSYESFINGLKYSDILRNGAAFSINTQRLGEELQKSGYHFTDSEKIMLEKQKEIDSLKNGIEQKNFIEKYGKQITDFNLKYKDTLQNIGKANKTINNNIIVQYFEEHKINLTADEKKLWDAITEHDHSDARVKLKAFQTTFGDSISEFFKKHTPFINELMAQKTIEIRNKNLENILGIGAGFGRDIMLAQDYCRNIVEEKTPVSKEKLQKMQQQLVTPFIANYIELCNNQAIAILEANRHKTGFVVNDVPKTEADKLFEAIIQKYKGKVVYVDFWATWCSPCRSGIERIKPLKEELADQNIVFVYITNQTSPQGTWSNMIPDIKGEHYRVSNDEWNYLKEMFNISGIPHYVLVGKNGAVINPNFGHYDNDALKSKLVKYINE